MRRVIGTLTAFTVVAAGLVMAAPARAATASPATITVPACTGSPLVPTLSSTSISGQTGDTFTFTNSTTLPAPGVSLFLSTTSGSATATWTGANPLTVSNGGSVTVTLGSTSGTIFVQCPSGQSASIAVTIVPGGGGSTDGSAMGPAPLLQQFGLPVSGTCDDASPADLNWNAVSSGGWGVSWAHWINEGVGGAVCTRTLAYRNGSWSVSS